MRLYPMRTHVYIICSQISIVFNRKKLTLNIQSLGKTKYLLWGAYSLCNDLIFTASPYTILSADDSILPLCGN